MHLRRKSPGLASVFGALELRVLEALWRRGTGTVRDLCDDFPAAAYTTLMTTMDRLHRKGFISDPVGKAKSVVFTEEGLRESERLFRELFAARR